MGEKRKIGLFINVVFLGLSLFFLLLRWNLPVSFLKRAAEEKEEVVFETTPQGQLKRIWKNFSQGGEEGKKNMLTPAFEEIKALEPEHIRIDHLFDFYDTARKTAQGGKFIYNFSVLDERVKEITDLGATPFLCLSYFPKAISANLTQLPESLVDWEELINKVVQRYSGTSLGDKKIANIYYEVWNEPDNFGQMSPEQYFLLYSATIRGALKCRDCLPFKIGGPAITTLKKDWMESFLSLIAQNNLRLDFVSWHSYQKDPQKTLMEMETLRQLRAFNLLLGKPEIIVSEWGSTPEISPLHDSYWDASHTIEGVSLFKDKIDRVFAFELKDGVSPEGKKFWGRWGLLTNESGGITPKPRYFSFIFLNKLLSFEIKKISGNLPAIGSTDGQGNFAILVTRKGNEEGIKSVTVSLAKPPPGSYGGSVWFLDEAHNPTVFYPHDIYISGGKLKINFNSLPNGVYLIEIKRLQPL